MKVSVIIGWIVLVWLVIYFINHPDQVAADVHKIWHALFGSAA